jgi:hypothetical protein
MTSIETALQCRLLEKFYACLVEAPEVLGQGRKRGRLPSRENGDQLCRGPTSEVCWHLCLMLIPDAELWKLPSTLTADNEVFGPRPRFGSCFRIRQ